MSMIKYKILKAPEEEKFIPDYLKKRITEFRNKGLQYILNPDDIDIQEFYTNAKQNPKWNIVNEVKSIYKAIQNGKDYLLVSKKVSLEEKAAGEDYGVTHGSPIMEYAGFDVIPQTQAPGPDNLIRPNKIRVKYNTTFHPDIVEKIIEECDSRYRDAIKFHVIEVGTEINMSNYLGSQGRDYELVRDKDVFLYLNSKKMLQLIRQKKLDMYVLEDKDRIKYPPLKKATVTA